ncbi:MAG: dockerin type I repeat-containing protein [Planctomycetota bacterium]
MAKAARLQSPTWLLTAILLAWAGGMLHAQHLFWTAVNRVPGLSIRRSDLDGSNVVDIVTGMDCSLGGITVHNGNQEIYWIERDALWTRVFRASLDGDDVELIFLTRDRLGIITINPATDKLYLAGDGIRRLDLDGENYEALAELPSEARIVDLVLDVVNEMMYWVQASESPRRGVDIWRADLDGDGAEIFHHEEFDPCTYSLTVDPFGARLYWVTVDYRTDHALLVQRVNLDGTGIEEVARVNPGLDDFPAFLDIDRRNQKLYWVSTEDGVFFRANTNGSDVERIHEESDRGPNGLAVQVPGEIPPSLALFRRGDVNDDGTIDISDAVFSLGALFLGTRNPPCLGAANVNGDGGFNISDPVFLLDHIFLGGPPPPTPFPSCGMSSLGTDAKLGCERTACP